MVKELFSNQMDSIMKVNFNMENFKGLGKFFFQIDNNFMKGKLKIILLMAKEFINGTMAKEFLKENL